jgi:hypothetical protein
MAAEEEQPNEHHREVSADLLGPIGLSRRQFARKVGGGSAAALGLMWAAPKISTIRLAASNPGSSPPTSTTTTTTIPGSVGGMSVDDPNPCAGTSLHIHADGFAPNTGVNFTLDSPANPIGNATANSAGKINALYPVPLTGPFGAHTIIATGQKPGGQTLTLSAPIVIKTVADCHQGTEGSTVPPTTAPGASTSVPATTTPTTTKPKHEKQQGESLQQGSNLPFTGMNSTDLALAGGAAALAGWAIYGIGGSRDRDDEDVDDLG